MNRKLLCLLLSLIGVFSLVSCHDSDDEAPALANRTIIAYICGDNDLSSDLATDIQEMKTASKSLGSDINLIVFADLDGQKPYIAKLTNGEMSIIRKWDNYIYAVSPDNMHDILQTVIRQYPAKEYGLIMEGHGSGSLQAIDTISTAMKRLYTYGTDKKGEETSSKVYSINTTTMATVFSNLKDHDGKSVKFSFMFFDICCMQNVENDYELANYTDYIIAPISEVPSNGANYRTLLPLLTKDIATNAQEIINTYAPKKEICASVVKTEALEELLYQTREALQEIYANGAVDRENRLDLDLNHCIYYYVSFRCNILHDIQDVLYEQHLLNKLSAATYNRWKNTLSKAVIAKVYTSKWSDTSGVDFSQFSVNDDTFGGINMVVPCNFSLYTRGSSFYKAMNEAIKEYEWGRKIGWKELGW